MAWRKCMVVGCRNMVREGLRRPSHAVGVEGQQLADGETCWRCRRRQAVLSKAMRRAPKLTERDWLKVFELRCRSKRGEYRSEEDRALLDRAWKADKARYKAMDADVFDATVPAGSFAKARR